MRRAPRVTTTADANPLFWWRRRRGGDDRDDDCLECRVVGTATCFAVAAYSFSQRVPANRAWLTVFGSAWAVAGVVRALV